MVALLIRFGAINFELGVAPLQRICGSFGLGSTALICGVNDRGNRAALDERPGVTGGWLTAEYSMLPYSTRHEQRDIAKGKMDGGAPKISD